MRILISYVAFLALCLSQIIIFSVNGAEEKCEPLNCTLPKCACLSTQEPFKRDIGDFPQFVILTIDEAVRGTNYPLYRELLNISNPNGCPIQATFFVSHVDTNYQLVHELHRRGHEIASHSISKTASNEVWKKMNLTTWRAEMGGQRQILAKYAEIPIEDIVGARAPNLQTAGNITFTALQEEGFLYECSMPSRKYIHNPLFPYTLDYGFQRYDDCQITPCLKSGENYPGFWTVPMNDYITIWPIEGTTQTLERECASVDACLLYHVEEQTAGKPETIEETVKLFDENFERFYMHNKAPFPMFLREAWLTENHNRQEGLINFIKKLTQKKDVFFVSIKEVINWMESGENKTALHEYQQSTCVKTPPETECMLHQGMPIEQQGTHCKYDKLTQLGGQNKDMITCLSDCPKNYPWVGNVNGD
jgi:peptidoglycan/xylan/chitin deacetylase (PgdA/CDA1 family)